MSHLHTPQTASQQPGGRSIETHKSRILQERKSSDSFVVIGKTLNDMYYKDKCLTSQKEFLQWTKSQLGFSKSTTYEYIISYKIYSEIEEGLRVRGLGLLPPPIYQSHCQLLAKIPKETLIDSWIDVLKAAGDGQVTTAYLESYLEAKGLLTMKPAGKAKQRSLQTATPKPPKKKATPASKKRKAQSRLPSDDDDDQDDEDELEDEESDDDFEDEYKEGNRRTTGSTSSSTRKGKKTTQQQQQQRAPLQSTSPSHSAELNVNHQLMYQQQQQQQQQQLQQQKRLQQQQSPTMPDLTTSSSTLVTTPGSSSEGTPLHHPTVFYNQHSLIMSPGSMKMMSHQQQQQHGHHHQTMQPGLTSPMAHHPLMLNTQNLHHNQHHHQQQQQQMNNQNNMSAYLQNMPSKPATPLPPLLAGLPLDIPFIKQAGKNVVLGQQFDVSMTGVDEFLSSSQMWFGRVWCCVPDARPLSTSGPNPSPPSSPVNYASGLERILQTLFTKFANKEFAEGLFLIRAEMGADWCTPVLQHPHCILRHVSLPFVNTHLASSPLSPTSGSPSKPTTPQSPSASPVTNGGKGGFDTYIVFYLGPNIKEFCHVFRAFGLVSGVTSWSAVLPMQMPNMSLLHEPSDERLEEVATALCDMGRG